ncbi:MAG: hypothetical protein KGI50_07160 [Patescibacteria group bacterium]|nr:hypothetical protein [Patescibacteria group bacterium]
MISTKSYIVRAARLRKILEQTPCLAVGSSGTCSLLEPLKTIHHLCRMTTTSKIIVNGKCVGHHGVSIAAIQEAKLWLQKTLTELQSLLSPAELIQFTKQYPDYAAEYSSITTEFKTILNVLSQIDVSARYGALELASAQKIIQAVEQSVTFS